MRVGDVSRPRRLASPARLRWYAHHRAVRFARRMNRGPAASLVRQEDAERVAPHQAERPVAAPVARAGR
jgi:hypothetical protein